MLRVVGEEKGREKPLFTILADGIPGIRSASEHLMNTPSSWFTINASRQYVSGCAQYIHLNTQDFMFDSGCR